jgi:hypothetical protein
MNYTRNITIFSIILIIIVVIFIIKKDIEVFNNNDNNKDKDIVYEFKLGYGGIGDFIKYMRICKIESEIRNVKFYIDFDHPLNKYVNIKNKFIQKSDKNNFNIVKPFNYYYRFDKNCALNQNTLKSIDFNPLDFFDISDKCKMRYNFLKNQNNIPDVYEGIHLRIGDAKMKATKKNKDDDRAKNVDFLNNIDRLIKGKQETTFVLFVDNEEVKKEIYNKYSNVKTVNIDIVHTSDKNSDIAILDNLCDFLFLSNSQVIHSFSHSGFPIVASWIYQSQLKTYY